MTRHVSLPQARSKLLGLADALNRTPSAGAVAVTKRGKPVLALLPWDLHESLAETLEILGDETLMKGLRKSIKEARAGQTIPPPLQDLTGYRSLRAAGHRYRII